MPQTQPVYNIWIRGLKTEGDPPEVVGLKRELLVTDYEKLEFKQRYNNVGGWSLLMRNGTEQALRLRELLAGSSADDPGSTSSGQGFGGITVIRNGKIVFSGPVRGFVATSDDEDGPMIEFHGMDDTGYLSSRICMVEDNNAPGLPYHAPAEQGFGYWVYGPISTTQCLFNVVTLNIGPSASYNLGGFQNRRIPFLNVPPPSAYGPSYTVRARYQNLLEKCQEIATFAPLDPNSPNYNPDYQGLQFSIIENDAGTLDFVYGPPKDLRTEVVFYTGNPDLHIGGNIGKYEYGLDAPTINFSVVAGQNTDDQDPTTRWFAHRGAQFTNSIINTNDSLITYGLWEGFLDRRDIQYNDPGVPPPLNPLLKQAFIDAMDVQLREHGEITNLSVTVINNSPTQYFVDYNLGNFVSIRIEGQEIIGQVMDATVTVTKDQGEVVQPTVGSQVIGSNTSLFRELYRQQKNTGLLEKSR